jgi:subtilisin family serine protease
MIGWGGGNCGAGTRVGMVDTAVDATHPKIRGRRLQQRDFLSTGAGSSNAEHGTATAGLLVGQEMGMIPSTQLFAANVFRVRDKDIDTTSESVVLALNWLAENKVNVINLSLGGPRNLLIEAAVTRLLEIGVAVVAAAGNGGNGAAPVFPAAQPGVIAVTAIDASMSPYKKANRGDYISFAAPGVDIWTAAPGKDGIYVSGTSYAAPFVTAALAVARQTNGKLAWNPILKQMQTKARDLGAPGKDSSFGWGLIQAPACATARKT